LTLFLLCVLLANCEVLLQLGNGSALAVSLCVVAAWCFAKHRYELAGVLCFAFGLALKPQEIGLIWLFFLLAGGTYRRRAWQVSAVALVLLAVSVWWVSQVSPHWLQEWRGNIAATSTRGDLNDPGPTSIGNKGVGMIVSLQAVISYFWDDPHVYNPAAYLIGGALILIWCMVMLRTVMQRSRLSQEECWFALASMAALGLLPIYHRQYDVKILLLTIPACTILWAQGGVLRKFGAAVTTAGIVLTSDIPVAMLVVIKKGLHLPLDQFHGQALSVLLGRSATLATLLVGVFYLWVFARHAWLAKASAVAPVKADAELEMAALSA
jgi:hypothetical protein